VREGRKAQTELLHVVRVHAQRYSRAVSEGGERVREGGSGGEGGGRERAERG
jgi:hypothetical protein